MKLIIEPAYEVETVRVPVPKSFVAKCFVDRMKRFLGYPIEKDDDYFLARLIRSIECVIEVGEGSELESAHERLFAPETSFKNPLDMSRFGVARIAFDSIVLFGVIPVRALNTEYPKQFLCRIDHFTKVKESTCP